MFSKNPAQHLVLNNFKSKNPTESNKLWDFYYKISLKISPKECNPNLAKMNDLKISHDCKEMKNKYSTNIAHGTNYHI
jgi:hypothetical protein